MIARLVGGAILAAAKILTGAQARWVGCAPEPSRRIYFANHTSHLDFLLLWASLPRPLRLRTRPVAAADYWSRGAVRRFLIHRIFRGVLIDRGGKGDHDPLPSMLGALDAGDSLILFPEGTRNLGDEMLPFKSGLYHLAAARPEVENVPVRIENLNRVLPKGEIVPVPLLCSLAFGEPIRLEPGEEKRAFLERARAAVLELRER